MTHFNFSNTPIEFEELSNTELGRKWESKCHKSFYPEGWIRLGKIKAVFSRNYLRYIERIRDFQTCPDDVWVASFPKCGTTWTQEMVYCIATDCDFDTAKKVGLEKRFPYWELHANWTPDLMNRNKEGLEDIGNNNITENENKAFFTSFDQVDQLKNPRFIKTHLHYSLLPNTMKNDQAPKMIYVARNPKDTCISWYHHQRLLDGYSGSLEDFVEAFVTDNVFAGPYWTHLKEYWELRDRHNILFIKYEDMKKDLPSVIRKTAKFLNKTLTDEQVNVLKDHLSFESMKNNPAVNMVDVVDNMRKVHGTFHDSSFMRKGQVGSYKDDMTPEMVKRMDAWIAENKIVGLYES